MSMLGNTNPIPGLDARYATLSKAALFLQYQTGFNPDGSPIFRPGYESMGSSEKAEMKLTPTWAKVKKQDRAVSVPLAQTVTDIEVAISLTLTQQSPLIKALQIMAAEPNRKYTQGAQNPGSKKTLADAVPGLVYPLGYKDVTVASITWGKDETNTDIDLEEGVDYSVDRHAGLVYLRNKPVASTPGDPEVTFSAPALDATANLMSLAGFSGAGIRGRLLAAGRNVTGLMCDWKIHDVLFSSESTVQLQNTSTNYDQIELSGSLFPATTDDVGNILSDEDAYFTVTQQSQATLA